MHQTKLPKTLKINFDNQTLSEIIELNEKNDISITPNDICIVWASNQATAVELKKVVEGIQVNRTIALLPNDIFYIPISGSVSVGQLSTQSSLFAIKIDKEVLFKALSYIDSKTFSVESSKAIINSISDDYIMIHYLDNNEIVDCIKVLISDFDNCLDLNNFIPLEIIHILYKISIVDKKSFEPLKTASQEKAVLYTLKYIYEKYSSATLIEIAENLHYSTTHLSELLKLSTGMSFQEILEYRRAIVARQYLIESNLTIEDIAEKVGFHSYAGFYKFWVKISQISPREYRLKYSKENINIAKTKRFIDVQIY